VCCQEGLAPGFRKTCVIEKLMVIASGNWFMLEGMMTRRKERSTELLAM
jgi:hypothetical protein